MYNIKKYITKERLIFIGLLFVLILEIFVLVPYGVGRVFALTKKNNESRKKISAVKAEWPRKDSYLEKKNKLSESIEKEKTSLSVCGSLEDLISYVSACANKSKVRIETIAPIGDEGLAIEFSGGYHHFGNFFDMLQNEKYLVKVKKIMIIAEDNVNVLSAEVYPVR